VHCEVVVVVVVGGVGGMCLMMRGFVFDCIDGECLDVYAGACGSLLFT
jgi:hypothetical protein